MIAYDNVFLPTKDVQVGEEEPAVILKSLQKLPDARLTIWFEVDDLEQ